MKYKRQQTVLVQNEETKAANTYSGVQFVQDCQQPYPDAGRGLGRRDDVQKVGQGR